MKLKLLIVFLAVVMLLNDSDAGWWRRRRRRRRSWIRIRGRRILENSCRILCASKCAGLCYGCCLYGCYRACGKRELPEGNNKSEIVMKLPCRFDAWDLDNDGGISLEEFAFAGHAKANASTKMLFQKVDTDGDGKVSNDELNSAPLVRETC